MLDLRRSKHGRFLRIGCPSLMRYSPSRIRDVFGVFCRLMPSSTSRLRPAASGRSAAARPAQHIQLARRPTTALSSLRSASFRITTAGSPPTTSWMRSPSKGVLPEAMQIAGVVSRRHELLRTHYLGETPRCRPSATVDRGCRCRGLGCLYPDGNVMIRLIRTDCRRPLTCRGPAIRAPSFIARTEHRLLLTIHHTWLTSGRGVLHDELHPSRRFAQGLSPLLSVAIQYASLPAAAAVAAGNEYSEDCSLEQE